MTPPSNPMNKRTITRAGIVGALLAVLGIGLFMGIWIILGNFGVADFPRLISALCIPPGIIAAIMGIYILIARPYQTPDHIEQQQASSEQKTTD